MPSEFVDSAFVWTDVAKNCEDYSDSDGVNLLKQWSDHVIDFDRKMKNKETEDALKLYYPINELFRKIAPHMILNDALENRFADAYPEVKKFLDAKDYRSLNQYEINQYSNMTKIIGC